MDSYEVVKKLSLGVIAAFVLFLIVAVIYLPVDDPETPQNEFEEDPLYDLIINAGAVIFFVGIISIPIWVIMYISRSRQPKMPFQQPYYQQQYYQQPTNQYQPPMQPPNIPPHQIPKHSQQSPLELLQMRYARGEISKEQFNEMKNELQGKDSIPVHVTPPTSQVKFCEMCGTPNKNSPRFCSNCGTPMYE